VSSKRSISPEPSRFFFYSPHPDWSGSGSAASFIPPSYFILQFLQRTSASCILVIHRVTMAFGSSRDLQGVLCSDFHWGYAAAATQVEGGWNADGKGISIWDTFAHTLGKVRDGSTPDDAVLSYYKYKEDVSLMKSYGVTAYRFSVVDTDHPSLSTSASRNATANLGLVHSCGPSVSTLYLIR
jgi:hypothetical protein